MGIEEAHVAALQTRTGNDETSMTVDGAERPAQAISPVQEFSFFSFRLFPIETP